MPTVLLFRLSKSNSTIGDRAFPAAAAVRIWNSLTVLFQHRPSTLFGINWKLYGTSDLSVAATSVDLAVVKFDWLINWLIDWSIDYRDGDQHRLQLPPAEGGHGRRFRGGRGHSRRSWASAEDGSRRDGGKREGFCRRRTAASSRSKRRRGSVASEQGRGYGRRSRSRWICARRQRIQSGQCALSALSK